MGYAAHRREFGGLPATVVVSVGFERRPPSGGLAGVTGEEQQAGPAELAGDGFPAVLLIAGVSDEMAQVVSSLGLQAGDGVYVGQSVAVVHG